MTRPDPLAVECPYCNDSGYRLVANPLRPVREWASRACRHCAAGIKWETQAAIEKAGKEESRG